MEIHAPEVKKVTTKRRINLWFDHAAYHLKPREEQKRKNGSERKLRKTKKNTNKSIRHTRPTFKITKKITSRQHFQIQIKNNIRVFYKTVKMLVDNQEKNCQKQIITYRMNLLSSSWTRLKTFAHSLITHTSLNVPPEIAHPSRNFIK